MMIMMVMMMMMMMMMIMMKIMMMSTAVTTSRESAKVSVIPRATVAHNTISANQRSDSVRKIS